MNRKQDSGSGKFLQNAIRRLSKQSFPKSKLALAEQPFDLHLLTLSSLYKKSRQLFLDQGGKFTPTLVSSPRTLSSAILLENQIEYSPIEKELVWTATDPLESRSTESLFHLRSYCSSLFHEQNHRILWKFLPPAPKKKSSLRRYLHLAESLVITTDMALGDQLGPKLAQEFYSIGVTYDPGTSVWKELKNKRQYRNYLQAALYATYLHLELYDPKEIPNAIGSLFPHPFAIRAADRSGKLDPAFIRRTNPNWQNRHWKKVAQKLGDKNGLELPEDPVKNHPHYLIAEKWFDFIGL